MLLAAEAWTGEPTAFPIDESWEKVDSLLAMRLGEALSSNPITRRELTHMADLHVDCDRKAISQKQASGDTNRNGNPEVLHLQWQRRHRRIKRFPQPFQNRHEHDHGNPHGKFEARLQTP